MASSDKDEKKVEDSLARLQKELRQEAQEHKATAEKAKKLVAALKQQPKS